jgi:hypothetical protein
MGQPAGANNSAVVEDLVAFHNQRIAQCKPATPRMRQPAPRPRQQFASVNGEFFQLAEHINERLRKAPEMFRLSIGRMDTRLQAVVGEDGEG